jgi:hypothetical protein
MDIMINWFDDKPEFRIIPDDTDLLEFVVDLHEETEQTVFPVPNFWIEVYYGVHGWVSGTRYEKLKKESKYA